LAILQLYKAPPKWTSANIFGDFFFEVIFFFLKRVPTTSKIKDELMINHLLVNVGILLLIFQSLLFGLLSTLLLLLSEEKTLLAGTGGLWSTSGHSFLAELSDLSNQLFK
jgi:membrane protein required for beta-lactamase induction